MKKFEIVITADTNDADYVTNIAEITQEELNELMPTIEAIKQYDAETKEKKLYNRHNWPDSEYCDETVEQTYPCLTEDQIQWMREFVPTGEYGIHTIESIVYYEIPTKVKLL